MQKVNGVNSWNFLNLLLPEFFISGNGHFFFGTFQSHACICSPSLPCKQTVFVALSPNNRVTSESVKFVICLHFFLSCLFLHPVLCHILSILPVLFWRLVITVSCVTLPITHALYLSHTNLLVLVYLSPLRNLCQYVFVCNVNGCVLCYGPFVFALFPSFKEAMLCAKFIFWIYNQGGLTIVFSGLESMTTYTHTQSICECGDFKMPESIKQVVPIIV